jgi:hypothetical protein
MPGYDRTGPMGAGARTGRERGRGARPAEKLASVEDPYQYYGVGWGYWPWADDGGHGFRGGRRGRGRGFGRSGRAIEDPATPDGTSHLQETLLIRRMEALTAQLDDLKKLLTKQGPADGQTRE